MSLHDKKRQFYSELYHKIDTKEITSEEFVNFVTTNKTNNPDDNQSGFFELCQKFVEISLNAEKYPDPTTCDVTAVFLHTDVNAAKGAFIMYVANNKLLDIDGVLEAIRLMHMYAVLDEDPRTKSAMITPSGTSSFAQLGYIGKFHNFCTIPHEMWIELYEVIKKEYS